MTFTRQPDACIQHALLRHAKDTPDAVAIVAPGRSPLDYAGLWTRVSGTATVLRGFGLEPCDRIALVMPDGPDMAVAFLAASAVAAAAPLNPACRQSEFETYFDDLHVKMLLTAAGDDSPAVTAARIKNVRIVRLAIDKDAAAGVFTLDAHPAVSLHDVSYPCDGSGTPASAVALVLTTSGTTSRPKVVALTHANIYASAFNIGASLQLSAHDRCLDVMPLFHVHGLHRRASVIAGGRRQRCVPTWFRRASILRLAG